MKKLTKRQQINQLEVLLVALLLMCILTGLTIYLDWAERPGFISTVWAAERGTDYVELSWKEVRNADKYVVTCESANDIRTVVVKDTSAKIDGLKEGESYNFTVRADSKEREGFKTVTEEVSTKRSQQIEGKDHQMKLSSRTSDLGLSAETKIVYESEDGEIEQDGDGVKFNGSGTVTVKATAVEDEDYTGNEKEVTVDVLDSVDENPSDAEVHIMYELDKNNCEVIKTIEGEKGAYVPQSFAYDGNYVVAYEGNRIVTFGEERKVETPSIDLGHANGFTYSDNTKKYYSVRGHSSKCVTYDGEKYDEFNLACGTSGIAYDRKRDMFYTSSKPLMVAYDSDFKEVLRIGTVAHKDCFSQDCGGYAGIMMHCVSGKNRQATNYVDLYDMVNGKYLGSVKCELGEVESAVVDDDGYMVLLCNTKQRTDYIYKTPVNIGDLGL